ncbi:MAG TPA: glycosyltransferase, partial [Thermoanaerobaculia bacterium]|nr:glycosyltransferase [Thermoanaerobaculia bacterium]
AIRSETNLGFTGGANAALRHSSTPYVALVNNDVVLDREWLATVRDALDRDAQLAAVQTIIRRPDGLIDGAGIDVSDGTYRQIGHGARLGEPLAVAWGVSATATLYRRAAVGDRLFDERFFAYYEDVELCARLREQGWRTAVLPVVKATHRGSQSAGVLGKQALRLRTRNRYFVARLHRGAGRIRALLWEDARLALHGRTSLRGIIEGLCSPL